MLSLRGVPGIYFHSLFGSTSWHAGVAATGRYRTVNREKLAVAALTAELENPRSQRSHVFAALRHLLQLRRALPPFHPAAPQRVLALSPAIVAIERRSLETGAPLLALINVTGVTQTVPRPAGWLGRLRDLVSGTPLSPAATVALTPYQVAWLQPA
jgi:sucrose phosphorylase